MKSSSHMGKCCAIPPHLPAIFKESATHVISHVVGCRMVLCYMKILCLNSSIWGPLKGQIGWHKLAELAFWCTSWPTLGRQQESLQGWVFTGGHQGRLGTQEGGTGSAFSTQSSEQVQELLLNAHSQRNLLPFQMQSSHLKPRDPEFSHLKTLILLLGDHLGLESSASWESQRRV